MRDFVGNDTTVICSPDEITEEIIKIAVYCRDGAVQKLPAFKDRWGGKYSVAIGGDLWVDLTLANKAIGLRAVCDALSIDPTEVMAFGDNFNDLDMLRIAGVSCVMARSHPEVKAAADQIVERVEPELERFLRDLN